MDLTEAVKYFHENEHVRFIRRYASYLGVVKGRKAELDFIVADSYLRWVDTLVDSGENPEQTAHFLKSERHRIDDLKEREPSSESKEVLEYLKKSYGNYILELFTAIFTGFEIDNSIISSQSPPSTEALRKRNISQTLYGFKFLTLIRNGTTFEASSEFENLMYYWARYDAIQDLEEDLRVGLILFDNEELSSYDVQLTPGERVPKNFTDLVVDKRLEAAEGLLRNSPSVQDLSLNSLEKQALKLYFASRAFKLHKMGTQSPNELVYIPSRLERAV